MGKVWHYCVVVMDICFLVGLPPSVIRAVVMCMLMTVARAAGERTLSLNTLAIAAFFMLLYNPFIFLIPGSSYHFWLYFQFCLFILSFSVLAGASPCTSLYLGDSGGFAGGTVRDSSCGYL